MGDGEFEKRLRFDFIGDSGVVTKIPVGYMIQMLDEAQKEWPTEEMASKIFRERTGKWVVVLSLQQILASLRQDWFLKWFGSCEMEKVCRNPNERVYRGCTVNCKKYETCEVKEK